MLLDCIWVSDEKKNFILINIIGEFLCKLKDVCSFLFCGGVYIVINESELIYIERYSDINKLLSDLRIIILIFRLINLVWRFNCVYWFLLIRDLLIGIYDSIIIKVIIGKLRNIIFNKNNCGCFLLFVENVGDGRILFLRWCFIFCCYLLFFV